MVGHLLLSGLRMACTLEKGSAKHNPPVVAEPAEAGHGAQAGLASAMQAVSSSQGEHRPTFKICAAFDEPSILLRPSHAEEPGDQETVSC